MATPEQVNRLGRVVAGAVRVAHDHRAVIVEDDLCWHLIDAAAELLRDLCDLAPPERPERAAVDRRIAERMDDINRWVQHLPVLDQEPGL